MVTIHNTEQHVNSLQGSNTWNRWARGASGVNVHRVVQWFRPERSLKSNRTTSGPELHVRNRWNCVRETGAQPTSTIRAAENERVPANRGCG